MKPRSRRAPTVRAPVSATLVDLQFAQRFDALANRLARQRRNMQTRAENAPPPSALTRAQKATIFYLKKPVFEDFWDERTSRWALPLP